MKPYDTLTLPQRFAALDLMASNFFQTRQWEPALARCCELEPKDVRSWRSDGAPVWVLDLLRAALIN